MAKQVMTVSDVTGQIVAEADHVTIVVIEHPLLEHSVRLDMELVEFNKLITDSILESAQPYGQAKQNKAAANGKRSPDELNQIRAWARLNGWPELSGKGRIPADIEAAYEARS